MAPFKSRFATPWACLGIAKTSTEAEIKSAYRALALTNHPDKAPEAKRELATAIFVEMQAAYELCLQLLQHPNASDELLAADWEQEDVFAAAEAGPHREREDPDTAFYNFVKAKEDGGGVAWWTYLPADADEQLIHWAKTNATMLRYWRIQQSQKERKLLDHKYRVDVKEYEAYRREKEANEWAEDVAWARLAERSRIYRDDRDERWAKYAIESNAGSDRYTPVTGLNTAAQTLVIEDGITTDVDPPKAKPWWENKTNFGYDDDDDADFRPLPARPATYSTKSKNQKPDLVMGNDEIDDRDLERMLRDLAKPDRGWSRPNRQGYLPSTNKGAAMKNLSRARKLLQNTLRQVEATERRNQDQEYLDKWVVTGEAKFHLERKAIVRNEMVDALRHEVQYFEAHVAHFEKKRQVQRLLREARKKKARKDVEECRTQTDLASDNVDAVEAQNSSWGLWNLVQRGTACIRGLLGY